LQAAGEGVVWFPRCLDVVAFQEANVACSAFVALINYWAYFVAFEEAIYHIERWPLAQGWWRAMPTGGRNPCGGGRGREPGGFCWNCQHALCITH